MTIYGGMVMEQSKNNREKFKAEKLFPDISQTHASAISALVNFLSRIAGKPIPEDREDIQGQMKLIAHFVQGIQFVETAIVEGLYPQAATLLRQSMKSLLLWRSTLLGVARTLRHHSRRSAS